MPRFIAPGALIARERFEEVESRKHAVVHLCLHGQEVFGMRLQVRD